MKSLSRPFVTSVVILFVIVLASGAFARGGHRGARGGGFAGGNLCNSATLFDLSLSSLDIMIKTSGPQTAALDELKKVAKEYSDKMSGACAGDSPMSVPAKLAAAEKRLEVALSGTRKIRPIAENFYATLNDEQKAQANGLLDWPGL
jgi:hypothetical protein